MFFIRSENETGSVASQNYYMWNTLAHAPHPPAFYRFWTIPGSEAHAFGYWNDSIHDAVPYSLQNSSYTVRERTIGYFKHYLPIP